MTTTTNNNANGSVPMASLYVGDLHPDVTEAMLYEKFSNVGPVLSIRVCRDMVTRKSLGYAYVNFQSSQNAEHALDNMNFDTMKNKPIRIMWSQRDPSVRKSGVGNIFIKNLDKAIDQKEFYDTFVSFGNILSCKIATDDSGKSKGYGFVHFDTHEAAHMAIESINGMMINDKKVFVGRFIPRTQRSNTDGQVKFTNCYVKNFGDELDDEKMHKIFGEHGEIVSAVVMKDDNGKSKGFGFVCFKEPSSAEAAVEKCNAMQVGEKTIFVGRAQKKSERTDHLKSKFEKQRVERTAKYAQGVNLYVKNMDDTITDEQLKKEFEQFGNITSAKVMCDNNDRSKGFGFVCFSNPEEATKAVTEMNGKICGSKPLYVALAQRKEDRQAHLANQFVQRINQYRTNPNAYQLGNPMMGANPAASFNFNVNPAALGTAQMRFPNFAQNILNNPNAAGRNQMGPGQARWNQQQQMNQQFHPANLSRNMMQFQQNYGMQDHNNMLTRQLMMGQNPNMLTNVAAQQMQLQQQQRPQMMQNQQQAAAGRPITGQQVGQMQHARPSMANVVGGAAQNQPNRIGNTQIINQQAVRQNNQMQTTAPIRGGLQPLTATMLAEADTQHQKQMLGERLYPLVASKYPDYAGKVTGMLLDIDNGDLLHMLEDPESLKSKAEEAIAVLKAANNSGGQSQPTAAGDITEQ